VVPHQRLLLVATPIPWIGEMAELSAFRVVVASITKVCSSTLSGSKKKVQDILDRIVADLTAEAAREFKGRFNVR
jgi:hypothetical protein